MVFHDTSPSQACTADYVDWLTPRQRFDAAQTDLGSHAGTLVVGQWLNGKTLQANGDRHSSERVVME